MQINQFKYFYPEAPQLILITQDLVEKLSKDDRWVAEPKYNGQRCELHVMDGKIEFWGRDGEPLKYEPNEALRAHLTALFPKRGYYLCDGELRHNKTIGVQHKLILWDCFIFNNELMNKKPYWYRRCLLMSLGLKERVIITSTQCVECDCDYKFEKPITTNTSNEPVSLIEQYNTNFKDVFEHLIACSDEFEGVVLKNTQGKLNLGRKSAAKSTWMKKIRKATGRHRY